MKFFASVLALGAVLSAAPAVHAQIYINDNFDDNDLVGWTNTGGLWTASGGTAVVNVQGSAPSGTFSLSRSFSASGTGASSFLQYRWSVVDNNPAGFNLSAVLRNTTTSTDIYSVAYTTGTGGFLNPSVNLVNGNSYTLTFAVSSLSNQTTVRIDDVFVRQVPGPLPILGAFAAFGWSRKLRAKIRGAQA